MKRVVASLTDGAALSVILITLPLGFLLVMAGLPILYNIVMSFQSVDMFTMGDVVRPFVGLDNYAAVVTDPDFWPVMAHTLVFVSASVTGQFLLGLALALFFWIGFPGATWVRGLFLVSWLMPPLVIGAIWSWLLSGDFGVLNALMRQLHLIDSNIFWVSDPAYSLWGVVIANIWLGTSFNMILLSVGLMGIPKDLYEAAELDGAGPITRFVTITIPMMRSTMSALLALGLIFTIQQFDLFAAITSGGPNNSSNVAQYWVWDLAFRQYDFARAATISSILTVFVVLASMIYVRTTRNEVGR